MWISFFFFCRLIVSNSLFVLFFSNSLIRSFISYLFILIKFVHSYLIRLCMPSYQICLFVFYAFIRIISVYSYQILLFASNLFIHLFVLNSFSQLFSHQIVYSYNIRLFIYSYQSYRLFLSYFCRSFASKNSYIRLSCQIRSCVKCMLLLIVHGDLSSRPGVPHVDQMNKIEYIWYRIMINFTERPVHFQIDNIDLPHFMT